MGKKRGHLYHKVNTWSHHINVTRSGTTDDYKKSLKQHKNYRWRCSLHLCGEGKQLFSSATLDESGRQCLNPRSMILTCWRNLLRVPTGPGAESPNMTSSWPVAVCRARSIPMKVLALVPAGFLIACKALAD